MKLKLDTIKYRFSLKLSLLLELTLPNIAKLIPTLLVMDILDLVIFKININNAPLVY